MAKIVFLQNTWYELLGVMSIGAIIKEHGHFCEVFIGNESQLIKEVAHTKPNIIAFSSVIGQHQWALKMAQRIKSELSADLLIIMGGPYPTFCPEIIQNPYIDVICRGEGEGTVLELLDRLDKGAKIDNIQNLWLKNNGCIQQNTLRPLIKTLDDLPFPERSIYYKYTFLRKNPTKRFMTGRGCPFDCTYCFNHSLKELYAGKGPYIRHRSIEGLIEEINEVKRNYGLETVIFEDDTFNLNRQWLLNFLAAYRQKVKLPFNCYIRVDLVDEEIIRILSISGCHMVGFGIETGNEERRKVLLKKTITNEQIIRAAQMLHKYQLRFYTMNMLGLPGETLTEALETIMINQKIKPDHAYCSIFQPYPQTQLGKYTLEKHLVPKEVVTADNFPTLFHGHSMLNQKDIGKIVNLHKWFYLSVKVPKLMPLIHSAINLPPNRFFNLVFLITYFFSYLRRYRSIWKVIQDGWRGRRLWNRQGKIY